MINSLLFTIVNEGIITVAIEEILYSLKLQSYHVGTSNLIAKGLESEIYSVLLNGKPCVVKTPIETEVSNANDTFIDYRKVYKQEWSLLKQFNECQLDITVRRIPVPEAILLNISGDFIFMVLAFVENDQSSIDESIAVEVLQSLHQAAVPSQLPIANENHQWIGDTISNRIIKRIENIREFSGFGYRWLTQDQLLSQLELDINSPVLLHMDFRRDNILTNKNVIVGLVDWSNSIIGSPLIELARIQIYDEFSNDFLTKYLSTHSSVHYYKTPYHIYCLDTIVMLCLVFFSESPDRNKAEYMISQLNTLEPLLKDALCP